MAREMAGCSERVQLCKRRIACSSCHGRIVRKTRLQAQHRSLMIILMTSSSSYSVARSPHLHCMDQGTKAGARGSSAKGTSMYDHGSECTFLLPLIGLAGNAVLRICIIPALVGDCATLSRLV